MKSPITNEMNKVWLNGRKVDVSLMRNIFKKYEAFALVSISDTFWKHKAKCGHVYMPDVQFYQPDLIQVVDDRFIQILTEKQMTRNKNLQSQLKFNV